VAKKVLIVDDSALVRKQLKEIIETLGYEIDTAKNGQEAVKKATSMQYDVITMDINMPEMNGLDAVKMIMEAQPTPILMISSLTSEGAEITMDALDLGAVDYIAKPGTMNIGRAQNSDEIIQKVKSLSRIPARRVKTLHTRSHLKRQKVVETNNKPIQTLTSANIEKIVLIGSSTGGPGLIEQICSSLPVNYRYPVCIVQHMPEQFTKTFADRLNRSCALNVYETSSGQEILPGNVYVARGGVHLHFAKKVSGKIVVREESKKGSSFFQPSVNDMMSSALDVFSGDQIVGVILTGIGDDGADAAVKLKQAGAYMIGESEASATVYGMPRAAHERGGITEQLDFNNILKKITTLK
jgi:two-component system chemotaxis response regulator CheB